MTKQELRRGGGAKTSRSETVTVRLDPRLRYLAEVAAKVQRRTLSSYIESAVEASLGTVVIEPTTGATVSDVSKLLWFVSEPARLARLNSAYSHLLDINEQRLVRLAAAAHRVINPAGRSTTHLDERERMESEADDLRPYWAFLRQAAEDDLTVDDVLKKVKAMKDDLEGTGPVTVERIDKRIAELDAKHKKDIEWLKAKRKEVQATKV